MPCRLGFRGLLLSVSYTAVVLEHFLESGAGYSRDGAERTCRPWCIAHERPTSRHLSLLTPFLAAPPLPRRCKFVGGRHFFGPGVETGSKRSAASTTASFRRGRAAAAAVVAAGAVERETAAKRFTLRRGFICSAPGTRCCGGSSGRRGMGATAAVPGRWLLLRGFHTLTRPDLTRPDPQGLTRPMNGPGHYPLK